MVQRPRTTWLPRALFLLALATAAVLFVLVLLAPLLDNGQSTPPGASRLAAVFARDRTLRRTAIAAAVGLLATACIFFRGGSHSRFDGRRNKPPRTPPPRSIAGA
jgi:hypothetical protein